MRVGHRRTRWHSGIERGAVGAAANLGKLLNAVCVQPFVKFLADLTYGARPTVVDGAAHADKCRARHDHLQGRPPFLAAGLRLAVRLDGVDQVPHDAVVRGVLPAETARVRARRNT